MLWLADEAHTVNHLGSARNYIAQFGNRNLWRYGE
jgi:hypothetical protein